MYLIQNRFYECALAKENEISGFGNHTHVKRHDTIGY
jgi:hypothetical protein